MSVHVLIDVIVPLLGNNNLTSFADNLPEGSTVAQDVSEVCV